VNDHDEPATNESLVLLTVEEAARRLRIGRTLMYSLIRTGEVESIPVGRLRRIPSECLTEYVRRLRDANQPGRTAA
jgi:excisionase family DNA binding protein